MSIISKLALDRIRTHPKRSAVIAAAIILTSVLYMTVMSITVSIAQIVQLSMMLATGSDTHAVISTDEFEPTPHELLERVEARQGVDFAMLVTSLREYTDDHLGKERESKQLWAFSSEDVLEHIFIDELEGSFPANGDEILLNRDKYADLKLGDSITLTLTKVREQDGLLVATDYDKTFKVSGFCSGYADRQFPAIIRATPELALEYKRYTDLYINFESAWNIASRTEKLFDSLEEYLLPGENGKININNAYLSANPLEFLQNPANVGLVIISVGVIFAAAFLLICNIYRIALTQDMQLLGLLGVIGMTYRQQKRLTMLGALYIALVSLPIGLIIGYFSGWRLLSPMFMAMSGELLPYRFSPIILLLSAGLTLFTLLFSASVPLGRIKRLTPIETVSARDTLTVGKKSKHSLRCATVTRIALASIMREPKRLIVTSLSAALSVLLFVFVGACADMVREVTLDQIQLTDCRVRLRRTQNDGSSSTASFDLPIPEELGDELRAIPYVERVDVYRYAKISVKTNGRMVEAAKKLREQRPEYAEYYRYDAIIAGSITATVIGFPDEYLPKISMGFDERGISKLYGERTELQSGNYILSSGSDAWNDINFTDGDTIVSDSLSKHYTAIFSASNKAPVHNICGTTWTGGGELLLLLPMSIFEREFPDAEVFAYTLDAPDGREKELSSEVEQIIAGYQFEERYFLGVDSIADDYEMFYTRMTAVQVVGYSLAAMILLIAVINMVNSAFMSVLTRRREFAMLEAVGMTSRQLGIELVCENSFVAVTAAIALVIGAPLFEALINGAFGAGIEMKLGFSVAMLGVILAVCLVTSAAAYRMLCSSSVTERIRE